MDSSQLRVAGIGLFIVCLVIVIVLYAFTREHFSSSRDHVFLFWTGGYDSTFRLCQALVDQGKQVTPIYVSYKHLDNEPNKSYKRQNQRYELAAMENIRRQLQSDFPGAAKRLNPLVVIPYVKIQPEVKQAMYNIWKRRLNHRPMSQYGGLAQVAMDFDRDIEIAVEKSPHSTMRKMVIQNIGQSSDGQFRLQRPDQDLAIFRRLTFPTIYTSKKEMQQIAKKNGYDHMLQKTWSCWFPQNGKPCLRCPMCSQRLR